VTHANESDASNTRSTSDGARIAQMQNEIAELKKTVADLKLQFATFRKQFE